MLFMFKKKKILKLSTIGVKIDKISDTTANLTTKNGLTSHHKTQRQYFRPSSSYVSVFEGEYTITCMLSEI